MAVTDAEGLHVGRAAFLVLMPQQPELWQEATDMLSREVAFIQAALAERRRQKRQKSDHNQLKTRRYSLRQQIQLALPRPDDITANVTVASLALRHIQIE